MQDRASALAPAGPAPPFGQAVPFESRKKMYSPSLFLEGRDFILVRLIFAGQNARGGSKGSGLIF